MDEDENTPGAPLGNTSGVPLVTPPLDTESLDGDSQGQETGRLASTTEEVEHAHEALPDLRLEGSVSRDAVTDAPGHGQQEHAREGSPNSTSEGSARGDTGADVPRNVQQARASPVEEPVRHLEQASSQPESVIRPRAASLPADDGMGSLRDQIRAIQEMDIAGEQKAQMMHALLTQEYFQGQGLQSRNRPQVPSPASPVDQDNRTALVPLGSIPRNDGPVEASTFEPTLEDCYPTYAPLISPGSSDDGHAPPSEETRVLGCRHYKRNAKQQCSECYRWYTCAYCHDEVESHTLDRTATVRMLCMLCGYAQPAAEGCVNCGMETAYYYCDVCKYWNNDPTERIFHCNDCGICRIGRGLGQDYFHCKTCGICLPISVLGSHMCIERAADSDCPICGDYILTSTRIIMIMQCGHGIHKGCFDELTKSSYKCPICSKSITNMELEFRLLDKAIESQPMPLELQGKVALTSCNDCGLKSPAVYHFLGLKCDFCQSYNTVQLSTPRDDPDAAHPTVGGTETGLGQAIGGIASSIRRRRSLPIIRPPRPSEIPGGEPRRRKSISEIRCRELVDTALGRETVESTYTDDDIDFWGGGNLWGIEAAPNTKEGEDDGESDRDSISVADDGEGDDDDQFALFGHR